jgi:hypothetical protein
MKTRTIHNIPSRIKENLIEKGDMLIYNNGHYLSYIHKRNWYEIQCARIELLQTYTEPLRDYLTKYRLHHIMNVWDLKASFRLFGVDVYGTMEPLHYQAFLIVQGRREGIPSGDTWSGCLPFEAYKNACTEQRLTRIEN